MRRNLILAALSFVLSLGVTAAAFAQTVPHDRFATNRFSPAPGANNYLAVDGAVVGGHLTPSVGVLVDYAYRPFSLFAAKCPNGDTGNCEVESSKIDIVSYSLTFNAMASLTLWQRLQLGLVVPVVGTAGDSFAAVTPTLPDKYIDIRGGHAFGLGDPRFSAKLGIIGSATQGFALALVGYMTAPLGQALEKNHNVGDDTVTGGGHVALEYSLRKLRFAINAGGIARPKRELLSTEVGPEFTWGAAGSFDATPLVRIIGEVTGATQFTSQADENPTEARAAGEITVGDFAITFGGGAGLVKGVGVPVFRVLGGAAYRPQGLDSDGDGVSDKTDACPTELEDHDGFQDDDGCPDVDNDNDGIPDKTDKCPDDAEDPDGHDDADGCPDLDNDGDGIQDGYDSCPDQPEDKDGDRDEDGCPDNDRDRDGVADDVDKCPDNPEDTDGFGDEDGCPETDYDGDGIPDDEDQCPDQAEDKDGVEDADGCPEEGAPAPGQAPSKRSRTRG
jgi:OOP family OmpA-OmpF porin